MGHTILIVDDMPNTIEQLPGLLSQAGYTSQLATNGQQALALAEEHQPAVIVLDVIMPGMDGIEVCRALRTNPSTADIPVILVSSSTPTEARAEGMLAGATDYITRPILFPDLLERIERIIHHREDTLPDHSRMLVEMGQAALALLDCDLTWLLIVDDENRWLLNQSVSMRQGQEAAGEFLTLLGGEENTRFLLRHGDNPLADVVLSQAEQLNLPVDSFRTLPGGRDLHRALSHFDLAVVSLLPLLTSGAAVGVMVVAAANVETAASKHTPQILRLFSNQAAMIVDNAWLLADLAERERLVRSEQSFRQMMLDTMGDGLIVIDEDARITYVNNRLLNITRYTRDLLYGRSVGLLFHPNNREQLVQSLRGLSRDTLPFSHQLLTHDGSIVPVLMQRARVPSSGDGEGFNTVLVLTDLSELQRHENALRQQTQRLQVINQAANAMSSAHSFSEVITISLESALRMVQGMAASILLRDLEQPDDLVAAGSTGPGSSDFNKTRIAVGQGMAGGVALSAQSSLVVEDQNLKDLASQYQEIYGIRVSSVVVVPLITSDEVIGVLEVVNKHNGVFDRQDQEALESLAGSTAVTIENVRLLDQMRRRVTELSTLLDASAAVSSTLDFGDILERIGRRLSLVLQVERVVIADWNREANQLEALAEVVNVYWPPGEGPTCDLDRRLLAWAVVGSGNLVLAGAAQPDEQVEETNPSGLQAVAGFPLKISDQTMGVAVLYAENGQGILPLSLADQITETIDEWSQATQTGDPDNWLTRSELTDLCQQMLNISKLRWCSIFHRDSRHTLRLVREIGRALWLEKRSLVWSVPRYPSLARVLNTGSPLILQVNKLEDDPEEQAYLCAVGGSTCLAAPLFIRGEASGLIKLIDSRHSNRVFDDAELSLCQGIANVVGNAIDNAQLYTQQEQRASALEAAYSELQEADRLKDDLLQNLSHELRTPLTHILGYMRLLSDEAFGSLTPEQREASEIVVTKAQHLADLIKDIVTVQEAETAKLELKPVEIERVLAAAIRSALAQAEAHEIRLVPHVTKNLPLAYVDPERVGEVFAELLENAIKFSPSGTQVEVTLEDGGGRMLHSCIRDYGIGIPAEEHEKIFHRFYQVDGGTTRRFGGTGLGLAIVKQVVEAHGGRVWVESEPGQGSRFHVLLPKAITRV